MQDLFRNLGLVHSLQIPTIRFNFKEEYEAQCQMPGTFQNDKP